jgi:hypothetical protein
MANPEKTKGEAFRPELGAFGWLVRYEHTDTWIDFEAFEVVSVEMSPNEGAKSYARKGATTGEDTTYDVDDAEPTICGFVKWDGCSEMTLGRRHFCGAKDVESFAKAIVALHRLALILPKVNRECADYPEDARWP